MALFKPRSNIAPDRRTPYQIRQISTLSDRLFQLFLHMRIHIQPGTNTLALAHKVVEFCNRYQLQTVLDGYQGFPAPVCIGSGNIAAHGIPNTQPLEQGDLCTIDMVIKKDGWCADASWTYIVGDDQFGLRPALELAWRTSVLCARAAASGGAAMARTAHSVLHKSSLRLLPQFTGHGIGREPHEAPRIPLMCASGQDFTLPSGSVFTIEPVIAWNCPSDAEAQRQPNGVWLLPPGSRTAQYELMVAMLGKEATILGVPSIFTGAEPHLPFC